MRISTSHPSDVAAPGDVDVGQIVAFDAANKVVVHHVAHVGRDGVKPEQCVHATEFGRKDIRRMQRLYPTLFPRREIAYRESGGFSADDGKDVGLVVRYCGMGVEGHALL